MPSFQHINNAISVTVSTIIIDLSVGGHFKTRHLWALQNPPPIFW
jgi:hypothetical protein